MTKGTIPLLALAVFVGACNANSQISSASKTAHPLATTPSKPRKLTQLPAISSSTAGKNESDLSDFLDAGSSILAVQHGDLNADGRSDVVLVVDHVTTGDDTLGEVSPRTMLLLLRAQDHGLRIAGRNDKLVPCARCGGMFGDPFGYIGIDDAEFTVVTEGGSREHWSNEYVFAYDKSGKIWLLNRVTRRISDSITDQERTLTLTPREFGEISYDRFDPSLISNVTLP